MRSFPTVTSMQDQHALSYPIWVLMTMIFALFFALIPRAAAM
jgi:hypothetical protein